MDHLQFGLDIMGLAPGVGIAPDLLNALISACRGNYGAAGLSVAAAIPIIGEGVTVAKIAKKGTKVINVWPKTPQEMNKLLGVEGKCVPDKLSTPGRNKVEWTPNENTKITYEQHPYHKDAPDWHKDPHWHLDTPRKQHERFLPGEKIE